MKTLSVKSPWAYYLAWGVQTIERRSWSTAYRGPLAIHATGTEYAILPPLIDGSTPLHEEADIIWDDKKGDFVLSGSERYFSEDAEDGGALIVDEDTTEGPLFLWGLNRAYEDATPYPVQAIIGTVTLADVTHDGKDYCWHMTEPRPLKRPITAVRGSLYIWECPLIR